MATTTKELSLQLEEVTQRLRALESGQHVMTSSPGLPLEKWNDHGFVHRHEIKPLVRAINNGGGGTIELEERVEVLESGQTVLTSTMRAVEANQLVLSSVVNTKQDELTAGSGIDITNNVISATGGGSSSLIDKYYKEIVNFSDPSDDAGSSKLLDSDDNYNYVMLIAYKNTVSVSANQAIEEGIACPLPAGVTGRTQFKLILSGGYYNEGSEERCPIPGNYYNSNKYGLVSIFRVTFYSNTYKIHYLIDGSQVSSSDNLSAIKLFALIAIPK